MVVKPQQGISKVDRTERAKRGAFTLSFSEAFYPNIKMTAGSRGNEKCVPQNGTCEIHRDPLRAFLDQEQEDTLKGLVRREICLSQNSNCEIHRDPLRAFLDQ